MTTQELRPCDEVFQGTVDTLKLSKKIKLKPNEDNIWLVGKADDNVIVIKRRYKPGLSWGTKEGYLALKLYEDYSTEIQRWKYEQDIVLGDSFIKVNPHIPLTSTTLNNLKHFYDNSAK